MKIQGRKQISPLGPVNPIVGPSFQKAEPPPVAPASDQVDVSGTQQLRRLNAAAQALPAVRVEKVSELRGQIEEGSYHIESEMLARKVVDEALADIINARRHK